VIAPPRIVSGLPTIRPESSHTRETVLLIVRGMVYGMATTKITITLPGRQLEEIRKRVAAQDSPSVSGFIQQAVQKSLENAAQFRAMVEEALKETGGPLKPKERAWARKMLSARKRGTKPPKAA
jgi:Arc/MetJ-type ribon-helix-helix transcriptional regulator